jgi:predicted unusual protein kinase regulating ubiquinone biosynthesis (AarF/ABC1/UbiB family)
MRGEGSPVPDAPWARLLQVGRLAAGLTAGAVAAGLRQVAAGQRPGVANLLLTPANAARLADRLAHLRGAAMKVGQLLSMEAGDLLPPELTAVLARLREDARPMPLRQLQGVLDGAWGEGWHRRFRQFSFRPIAAASIGQVHRAVTTDGRELAIKVQYPGVRRSIDSDVDHLARLLETFRLWPAGVDVGPLLEEARRQLHREADYAHEADQIASYRADLGPDPDFALPEVDAALTTPQVLAMGFVPGVPIETLAGAPRDLRDRVATALLRLALREIGEIGRVQTDPNFANYRYDAATGRIGLLDFGATRQYAPERQAGFRALLTAAARSDRDAVVEAALALGYLGDDDLPRHRQAVADLVLTASEPARSRGPYDFAASDLPRRMRDQGYALGFEQGFWRVPPPDLAFLHRKLGGMFLLCARLRARVEVAALVEPYRRTG